jgi:phage terminase large subunit-like protein
MPADQQRDVIRFLAHECYDLYFWFTYVLRRTDGRTNTTIKVKRIGYDTEAMVVPSGDWVFARCNEVQDSPNENLDLWAREHYKSSIITFALSLLDVARDPEETVGVFSFRGSAANDFVGQWKLEMEANPLLPWCFNEVFWEDPRKQSATWSVQNGLLVKRHLNPRAMTFEGNALEYALPTGKHYGIMVFDDVVTEDSVTGDGPRRTLKGWELAQALGKMGGVQRYAGTHYAFNDAYMEMIKREAVKPRIHQAEDITEWQEVEFRDGKVVRGELRSERISYFMPLQLLDKKRKSMGVQTYSAQMLLDPRGDSLSGFNVQDLRRYSHSIDRSTVNVYLIIDPAKGKKPRPQRSDYTCMMVIGVGADRNFYLLDMVHDRLTLTERTTFLIELYRYWKPNRIGYEEVGMQSDIQHIEEECRRITYNIPITELTPSLPKPVRIEKLVPIVETHRLWLPETLFRTRKDAFERVDLMDYLVNSEIANYPALVHDDGLDTLAWILDDQMSITFPELSYGETTDIYGKGDPFDSGDWMAG